MNHDVAMDPHMVDRKWRGSVPNASAYNLMATDKARGQLRYRLGSMKRHPGETTPCADFFVAWELKHNG